MTVIHLAKYQCLETVRTLKVLMCLAIQGRTRGVCIRYMDDHCVEHTLCTGYYKRHAMARHAH